jgi:hypothetical protein
MQRIFAGTMLCVAAMGQASVTVAMSQVVAPQSALRSADVPVASSALPAAPRGKSTILGGEIRRVDPVRDEFTLRVFGQRLVKILFDERTQVYLDGKKVPLRDLGSSVHASIETVLDGTDVYALSIHILSHAPGGEYQGRVLGYDSAAHELTISSPISSQSIKLIVPTNTSVVHQGQGALSSALSSTSDLVKGDLISIEFESDNKGRGIASQIAILAAPGSAFIFSGDLSSLDMHSGFLVLVDQRDGKSYAIHFDSRQLPASQNLHEGDHLRVTATYDGTRYVANELSVD